MRYILEVRESLDEDSKVEETIFSVYEDAHVAWRRAVSKSHQESIWRSKVILWEEYDSMEEAPADTGCCYQLVERDGKRALRVCSAAC